MQKNKGLSDTQHGEFILNESGTSVSTDAVENSNDQKSFSEEMNENLEENTGGAETPGVKENTLHKKAR